MIFQTPLDFYEITATGTTLEAARTEAETKATKGVWLDDGLTFIPPQAIRVVRLEETP